MQPINVTKGDFALTTERSKMDIAAIHDFLSNHAYWCKNIPIERVKLSVENSLNFGVFHNHKQIG